MHKEKHEHNHSGDSDYPQESNEDSEVEDEEEDSSFNKELETLLEDKLDIHNDDASEHSESEEDDKQTPEEADFDKRLKEVEREGEKQKEMLKDMEANPAQAGTANVNKVDTTNEVHNNRSTFIQAKTWKRETLALMKFKSLGV